MDKKNLALRKAEKCCYLDLVPANRIWEKLKNIMTKMQDFRTIITSKMEQDG